MSAIPWLMLGILWQSKDYELGANDYENKDAQVRIMHKLMNFL